MLESRTKLVYVQQIEFQINLIDFMKNGSNCSEPANDKRHSFENGRTASRSSGEPAPSSEK